MTDDNSSLARTGGSVPAERRMWELLLRAHSWDLVVDVGAGCGEWLLPDALPPEAHIVAVEWRPERRECLARRVRDTGLPVEIVDHRLRGRRPENKGGPPPEDLKTMDQVLLDRDVRALCVRLDAAADAQAVLGGGEVLFRQAERTSALLEIGSWAPEDLEGLLSDWRMYLFDVQAEVMLRVGGRSADAARHLLNQGWVHPGHAVVSRGAQ